jgi:hypothetical protein
MRRRLRSASTEVLRAWSDRAGFDLVWRDVYSPIPDVGALPADTWVRPRSMPGIDWRPLRQREVLSSLSSELARFDVPPPYRQRNFSYDGADAEVLFGMIRFQRPNRIIEIGAGYSTLVISAAVRSLVAEGHEVVFTSVDPFPPSMLSPLPEGLATLTAVPAQALPTSDFTALAPGDVLFLDTTHVVKVGGEVNWLFLEVLPRLKPGVLVHVHDIFLPFEYPREWLEDRGYYWAEQYLLQALLSGSAAFEVLLALHWLSRSCPPHDLPWSQPAGSLPSAFWMRRAEESRDS